jgi:hypothetical protein
MTLSIALFVFWALFGVLFVVQVLARGKRSVLSRPVRLGLFEHPLRWFVGALGWWHRIVVIGILVAIGYGCIVDTYTRVVVAITVVAMVVVVLVWRRRNLRDETTAG